MSPMVISQSVMGIAATLLTAIPTYAITTAGSYLMIRGLVPTEPWARDL